MTATTRLTFSVDQTGDGDGDFTSGTFTTVVGSLLVAVVCLDHQGISGASSHRLQPSEGDWPLPITTGTKTPVTRSANS